MPRIITLYVRWVDAFNRVVGRIVMFMIFVMIGVLLFASVSRTAFNSPLIWSIEVSQFMMAAYYLLGGAYAMQMGAHVRMDLFYSRWSDRTRALVDALTIVLLLVFLGALLAGGISSTEYALRYGEKSYTSWAPPLAPIKIVMTFGIFLMLLQAFSTFFKDVARARGVVLEGERLE
ncbi:TRAP transporter small permease subunit [Halomonas sp. MCCC 1A17488]|uniref:TRAP transporter small permease protein n=1 Tax=Billgrantia sulfidoxydans TaxID=2733484 RepID=A0ABX7W7D1_9GAMM|nr:MULTISPECIES: TRAP transporter small permease subunit [Halomonas]MCE8017642.1 TRAP transporter small permease subunit [Halomonas sp. MCCC 1A17488]MCG3240975.1 TRAP transporter small permease subunit [Halomonas sp. MCCC 1A17488]QPP48845.1 TRAP transporter small permease subunit [Halomonas sp. SS10-MC5]QTP56176.1 TRAP transporter small permease subunit [Halomonas sulfidoxydans]